MDMSDDRFIKICGISSILAVGAYVGTAIFSIIAGLTKPETIADVGTYLESWYDVKGIMSTYGWFGIFGSLFTIPAILGYYQYLKKEGPMQWIPAAVIYHGVLLLTLGYIIPLIISNNIAPRYILETDAGVKLALATLAQTLVVAEEFLVIIGTILTLATGLAIIGIIDLKKAILPKWLNWLAIITGVLSIPTVGVFGHGLTEQIFNIVLIVDLVLMLIWMAAIGIIMILPRKKEIEA